MTVPIPAKIVGSSTTYSRTEEEKARRNAMIIVLKDMAPGIYDMVRRN